MFEPIAALCFFMQAQTVSVVRLYPVDDTTRDPEFRTYVGAITVGGGNSQHRGAS